MDVELRFSHIMADKMFPVRKESGISLRELETKIWYPYTQIGNILKKRAKGTIEFFEKLSVPLAYPEAKIKSMILESMLEAIQQESGGKEFKVAFKNYIGSSPELRDLARAALAVESDT